MRCGMCRCCENLLRERFNRCLDLYLCPRVRKNRKQIDPESLIPKLPRPSELRPYPTTRIITYFGHSGRVHVVDIDPTGLWLASGGQDGIVRVWEIATGRCMWSLELATEPDTEASITALAWSPSTNVFVLSAARGATVHLLVPQVPLVSSEMMEATERFLDAGIERAAAATTPSPVPWTKATEGERKRGAFYLLEHTRNVMQVTWHSKGDYFAAVINQTGHGGLCVHQISKHATQLPFKKTKGSIQRVIFHPLQPVLFVATQRYVRVYNLAALTQTKTLMSGVKWISTIDVHPEGENVIIGSYDRRLCWFDLDLSSKPYKTLRPHRAALRQVAFHRKYPLFASASDDGNVQIFHSTVYADLMQNPLIVPVKTLRAHTVDDDFGAMACKWHPTQPWLVTAGGDGQIHLWS